MTVSVNRGSFRRLVQIVVVLGVAACGGGGGGGGGGGAPGLSLSLSTHALTFTAANQNASPPAPQTVTATISGSGSGTLYVLIQPSNNPTLVTVSNVVINQQTSSGSATVSAVLPSNLGVGAFTGTITITACLNDPTCATGQISGSPQTVNVTYTISGVAASPSSLSYSIGNAPIPADFTRQIDITGAPNQNWTASSTVPWLLVSPTTGSTAATVHMTASLDQTQVDAMNNGTVTGSIQIVPASAGLTLNVPVTLTVARTQVNFVAPYVGTSNTSAPVIIRGENFSQATITGVNFGVTSGTGVTVDSDTQIRVNSPALSAGTYPVQLQSNLSSIRSLANLVVVDAPAYAATTLAYSDATSKTVSAIRYDAERQTLIVVLADGLTSANNRFSRYIFGSGAWGAPTTTTIFNLTDMALSTDGKVWLAETSGAPATGTTQYDAATFAAGTTTDDSINISGFWEKHLAVANDGTAVITAAASPACGHVIRYTIRNPQVSDTGAVTCSPPFIGGTADGSLIVVGTDLFSGKVTAFNAATGASSQPLTLTLTALPALDRAGSRIVLNNTQVYDSGFNLLSGALPNTTLAVVLKADGTAAYTYDSSGKVRKFDLTGTPVAGIYPEIGGGTTLVGSPGSNVRMTITPDSGTLFLAGGTQIVVQPVP